MEAIETARATLEALGADIQVGVYANAFPSQPDDEEANATITEVRTDLDPGAFGQ